jgi:pimeloyl-ACP methyl ester carboxylesterase
MARQRAALLVTVTECETRVQGVPVRYRVGGMGEPVVLVHGLAGSLRWWTHTIPALARRYRVYLVDLPAYGALHRHRPRLTLAQAASWLWAWMDAVALPRAHLVGHSMGGSICAHLAAQHPDAVHRLVLVAPTGVPMGRSLPGYLLPLLRAVQAMPPRFLPLLAYDALRAGPLTLMHGARDILAQDLREDLAAIAAPTLLIWGTHDTLVPPTLGTLLQQRIPTAHLLLLERAGHVPMYDRPRAFNEVVLAFLAGQEVDPRP